MQRRERETKFIACIYDDKIKISHIVLGKICLVGS